MELNSGSQAPQTPLRLWRGVVLLEWLDYNGHMTEHRYLQVFGESSDALYAKIGVDFEHADRGAYYTLETHIKHRSEAKLGTSLWSETEILGYDEKRLHLYHRLFDEIGHLLAVGEHLSIHVQASSVAPAGRQMINEVRKMFDAQRTLPLPENSGSVLRKPLEFTR
uniref:thioesterase family protein n=1 Tax=Ensifer adhaerens TaxID=106592 RepID=UPI003F49A87C